MALSEFQLIQRYFSDISLDANHVVLGVGDDCAVLEPTVDCCTTLSIDTLVSGVHFPADAAPFDIAQRALAVNLSDIAAMGAKPSWFLLAITLPEVDEYWLQQFSNGLRSIAQQYHCPLVGGDTTRGPLSITIQVGGTAKKNQLLTRHGAKVGNEVYITGIVGDGAAALQLIQKKISVKDQVAANYLYERFYSPTPRIAVGSLLAGIATAAIDVSDGLAADVNHIAEKSAVGITLEIDKLPYSPAMKALFSAEQCRNFAVAGGDDYELCFTLPTNCLYLIEKIQQQTGVPITKIGTVTAGSGLTCVDQHGSVIELQSLGYQHF